MDLQDVWTAGAAVLGLVLGAVVWREVRSGRSSYGLDPRGGGLREFAAGCVFAVPFSAALLGVFLVTGQVDQTSWHPVSAEAVGTWVYFLVLFLLEEVVFRSLLMTGLGMLAGQLVALVGTAVLVALAYSFADHSGLLPVAGAVVTNLMTGVARWRTGRIWWGLGQRWVWNSSIVTFGFSDSAFSLGEPVLRSRLDGPDWLTGGSFGVEGGLIGIVFLVVMTAAIVRWARGRRGPWVVSESPVRAPWAHDR